MKTKQLPKTFKRKGFEWELIIRLGSLRSDVTKHFGLYKQGLNHYVSCEILQGTPHPKDTRGYSIVERIPSDSQWGCKAFTFTSQLDAFDKWSVMFLNK